MKSISIYLLSALSLISLSFTPTNPAQDQKIALVSVYCSKMVDMTDFTGSMAGIVNTLANSEDFKLDPFVDQLHKNIMDNYLSNLDYTFMPEEEVLNHEGYDESLNDDALLSGDFMIRPEGYESVHTRSKKAQKATIAAFPEVDGIMMVGIDYKLVKMVEAMGFGTAKIQANVHLRIIDRKSKKLLNVLVNQRSDGKIKFALGGVFDTDVLMPLVEDATKKALARMDEKIIRKQK